MAEKGAPKTGGRRKGVPNIATREIKAAAQKHGPAALTQLVALMESNDERTRLAACTAVLDRGYGRPAQAITGADDEPDIKVRVTWGGEPSGG